MADFYENLVLVTQNEQTLSSQILENAKEICERRKQYAQSLSIELENIKSEKNNILTVLNDLNGKADLLPDVTDISSVKGYCTRVKTIMDNYINNVERLCERFRNQKIRIVSFGPKSQGKSLFTKLYTGLDDRYVTVKDKGTLADKTGALNVIHYEEGLETPRITVSFKSKQEILNRVNEFIALLPSSLGVEKLNSFEDLETSKSAILNAIENARSSIKASCKDGLKGYLGTGISLEKAGNIPTDISIEDLPKYNDIQYAGTRYYSSVDHIDIFVGFDLFEDAHSEMFRYFEISDTKGSSTDEGGEVADKDIFKAIDQSDAAFSISRVGQSVDNGSFILNQLYDHYYLKNKINELHEKLFVILSLEESLRSSKDVKSVIDQIDTESIANSVFVGSLITRPIEIDYDPTKDYNSDELINPNHFVKAVLLKMLQQIVINTKSNDDNLINKSNEDATEINRLLTELKLKLNNIGDLPIVNSDSLIKRIITTFRDETDKNLIHYSNTNQLTPSSRTSSGINNIDSIQVETARRHGLAFNSSSNNQQITQETSSSNDIIDYKETQQSVLDYEQTYYTVRKDDNSIYYLLTGDKKTIRKDVQVKKELEEAIEYLYQQATNNPIVLPDSDRIIKGSSMDLGTYIECISNTFSERINTVINVDYTSQKYLDITKDVEDVCRILWDGFRFSSMTNWGEYNNILFKEKALTNQALAKCYEHYTKCIEVKDTLGENIYIFTPFDVLVCYFKNQHNESTKEVHEKIVDDKVLKESILQCIIHENLPKVVVSKIQDKKKAIYKFVDNLSKEMRTESFLNGILPLYKLIEARSILGEDVEAQAESNERSAKYNLAKSSVCSLHPISKISIPSNNGTTQD